MLLAALPATPVQLAHACYRIGFEIVVPASWGDELVAHAVLEDLPQRGREPVIQCTCPLVTERLLANGQHLASAMVRTAAPPVAAAHYARDAFAPRVVHITYIGACPGAQHNAIDQRCLPDEFLRLLSERDVVLTDMPTVFDSVLPPDRRRFVSLPGGCPTQEALWHISDGRMLREVTQPTFSTDLAQTLVWREYVMIDVAPSLGCACAGSYSRVGGSRFGRVAVTALEPPRASQPVVAFQPEFAAVQSELPHETEFYHPPVASSQDDSGPLEPLSHHSDSPELTNGPEPPPAPDLSGSAETNRVHVRTPPSSPLPRAYLAKRRHFTTLARDPVTPLETFDAPAPAFEANGPPPEPEPSEAPNDVMDSARPIALHVEPEPVPLREAPPETPTIAEETTEVASADEPVPAQPSTATELEAAPSSAQSYQDAAEEPAKVPSVVVLDEPKRLQPEAKPLRVEVEFDEEAENIARSVLMPHVVASDDTASPTRAAPKVVKQPLRAWADLLIAVWLVLVASAVIASLLWRR